MTTKENVQAILMVAKQQMDEPYVKLWPVELLNLCNSWLDQNEKLDKVNAYIKILQPLLAAAWKWENGKFEGEHLYDILPRFIEEYERFVEINKDFYVPLKTFSIKEYIEK